MKLIGNKKAKTKVIPRAVEKRNVQTRNVQTNSDVEIVKDTVPRSKRKIRIVTALLIISIILAGSTALAIGLNYYVSSLNTIFPNVWMEGIRLSEMTLDEAVVALLEDGYEENANGTSMTLVFPDETSFTLTGDDLGLSLDAHEAAEEAFRVGRVGNASFFQNELTFVRAVFGGIELQSASAPEVDFSMLSDLVAEYTQRFNDSLFDGTLENDGETITIVTGAGFEPIDFNEVYNLARNSLAQAVEENTHVVVHHQSVQRPDNFNLHELHESITVEPLASWYDVETMSATPSTIGRTFDLNEALRLLNNAERGETIVIPIHVYYPEFTQEDIEAMLLRDVLSESSTQIGGTANRAHNVALSAEYINGTVLQPGEEFSFNGVVGRRTRERGFRDAGVFLYGRLVDQPGGGICQTSSTIYDALLRTTLEVTERRNHSRRISYLPLGHDASVFYGQSDFRFRNNMDFPVKIETEIVDRLITVRIIGTRLDDTTIEVRTNIINEPPFSTVELFTADLPAGQRVRQSGSNGLNGATVDVYQRFYDGDGNFIEEIFVGRSRYQTQNRVYLVGTFVPEYTPQPDEPPPPPPPPPPEEAPPADNYGEG